MEGHPGERLDGIMEGSEERRKSSWAPFSQSRSLSFYLCPLWKSNFNSLAHDNLYDWNSRVPRVFSVSLSVSLSLSAFALQRRFRLRGGQLSDTLRKLISRTKIPWCLKFYDDPPVNYPRRSVGFRFEDSNFDGSFRCRGWIILNVRLLCMLRIYVAYNCKIHEIVVVKYVRYNIMHNLLFTICYIYDYFVARKLFEKLVKIYDYITINIASKSNFVSKMQAQFNSWRLWLWKLLEYLERCKNLDF